MGPPTPPPPPGVQGGQFYLQGPPTRPVQRPPLPPSIPTAPPSVQGRTVSRQRSTIALVRRPSTPTVIPSGRRRPMRATTHREGSPGLPTAVLAIGVPGSLLTLPSTRTPPVACPAGCPRPVLSYAIRQSGRSLAAGWRPGGT